MCLNKLESKAICAKIKMNGREAEKEADFFFCYTLTFGSWKLLIDVEYGDYKPIFVFMFVAVIRLAPLSLLNHLICNMMFYWNRIK